MKLMLRTILLMCLCRGLLAQGQQPPDPATLARVEGRVVNSATGEPVRKAVLLLLGGTGVEYTATSDASGHFAIEQVAPGSYGLTVQHQSFTENFGATRTGMAGTKLTLSAGQSRSNLEIKLIPFGVISGKVVDPDGDPVIGVPITVMHWGFTQGGRQLMAAGGGASTNDRGEFRIYNLLSGRYFLMARPMRKYVPSDMPGGKTTGTQRERVQETYALTFYPSAPDVTAAAAIVLNPGQEASGRDIQLRKTRVFTVQGRLAGVRRGNNVSLSIQPHGPSSSASFGMAKAAAIREDNDNFTFRDMSPGRYILLVMIDNRAAGRQEISIADSDLAGIVVTITEPGSIKGKVLLEASVTGKPPALKGQRISLMPVDGIPMNVPNANTAADGSFGLEEVPADRYKVNCSPLDGAYLKTIRWNGQVSSDGTVEMIGGGAGALELEFATSSALIDGDVRTADDQPAPGASVLLVPASRRESDFRIIMADQKGHFSAKSVPPGGYTVLAADASLYGMPDVALLKALERFTTYTTVDQSGRATVSLKLIPETVIEAAQ